MPDAGRTRGPCVQKKCTLRTQVSQGSRDTRHSPRDGLRLIRGLLGVPSSLATVASHARHTRLDPSVGDRDRTISPSVPAAFVNAASPSIASRSQRP